MKEADDTLRFVTAEGRTIPRCGYRLEDFVDDDLGGDPEAGPSAEGFCTVGVQHTSAGSYQTPAPSTPPTRSESRRLFIGSGHQGHQLENS